MSETNRNMSAKICIDSLRERLRAQRDLPSPTQVATAILALARHSDVDLAQLATQIEQDPALAAKILRIANSAFYSQRRPSHSLHQALIIIGLNAALTLALSFSLLSPLQALQPTGIDYRHFWRRALLAATAARAFGEQLRPGEGENIFLAALLQDLGVLMLDRVEPGFYSELQRPSAHADWIAYEMERLGQDHSHFTALALQAWNLPAHLVSIAAASHTPSALPAPSVEGRFARCLALGSDLAEAMLAGEHARDLPLLGLRAQRLLSLEPSQCNAIIERTIGLLPQAETLFDTCVLRSEEADLLLAQARELLTQRSLQALQQISSLQAAADALQTRTEQAEDISRRDPASGAFNRSYLEQQLQLEFAQSCAQRRDLSIVVIDLGRLPQSSAPGQPECDDALHRCVQPLQGCVRNSDLLARHDHTQFIAVLPGADAKVARQIAQRMLASLNTSHPPGTAPVSLEISLGVASHDATHRWPTVQALMEAADNALYTAKLRGRNRVESHDQPALTITPTQSDAAAGTPPNSSRESSSSVLQPQPNPSRRPPAVH